MARPLRLHHHLPLLSSTVVAILRVSFATSPLLSNWRTRCAMSPCIPTTIACPWLPTMRCPDPQSSSMRAVSQNR
ncbi:hypothetical protein B0T10DRAFT_102256 [Thelonectria olida]|uniref:Secreted protein n=1 Tax=Thelonectria olida TaxID=1576542 RepID=A0A9P8WG63_9HYPO|nr:hypothetical protein B0T10DRAFT_102256 [Thelonectria olida]